MVSSSEDQLPSYDDVLKEDQLKQQQQNTTAPRPSRPPTERPSSHSSWPPRPPRPQPSLSSPSSRPQHRPQQQRPTNSNGKPPIPWVYPRGYYCQKCANTGYKLKNGHSCKTCWRQFAPANRVCVSPPPSMFRPYGMYSSPFNAPAAQPGTRPLMVRPGDPRLGGVICGNCRGSGRIRFFLDEDLCPLCGGIGRITPGNTNAHVTF